MIAFVILSPIVADQSVPSMVQHKLAWPKAEWLSIRLFWIPDWYFGDD
jgi:hypothetical protein